MVPSFTMAVPRSYDGIQNFKISPTMHARLVSRTYIRGRAVVDQFRLPLAVHQGVQLLNVPMNPALGVELGCMKNLESLRLELG